MRMPARLCMTLWGSLPSTLHSYDSTGLGPAPSIQKCDSMTISGMIIMPQVMIDSGVWALADGLNKSDFDI